MNRIIKTQTLAPLVKDFWVESPVIAKKRKAGQFVLVRVSPSGERIPLTIVDSNPEEGTLRLIFQEVGKTTRLMGTLTDKDSIIDVVGPLGKPTHIDNFGTVVCIGGGIGTAPVLPIAKAMKAAGNKVISIVGARSKDLLILEREMSELSEEIIVTTDDGSYGMHGFVTDALKTLIERGEKIDLCVAIGPVIMMSAVSGLTKEFNITTVVSLNSTMVDGTGMCGGCRVSVNNKPQFVCVDGPEFDGHSINFKELLLRQKAYLTQEREALERFEKEHHCKLDEY